MVVYCHDESKSVMNRSQTEVGLSVTRISGQATIKVPNLGNPTLPNVVWTRLQGLPVAKMQCFSGMEE